MNKEFYEIMEHFEKSAPKYLYGVGSSGFTKELRDLWGKQIYYCDSAVNDSFRVFLRGVALGKLLNAQDDSVVTMPTEATALDQALHLLDKRRDEIGLELIANAFAELKSLRSLLAKQSGAGEKWIPVSERLPERKNAEFSEFVLTTDGERIMLLYMFNDGERGWKWGDDDNDSGIDVTHWQPLPAPPSIDKKEEA